MPLERMRVGISSDNASQTQTPGPRAKNAMNAKVQSGDEPAVLLGRHGRDERVVNFQRRGLGRVQIGKRILEEGRHLVRRQTAGARNFHRYFAGIIGALDGGGGAEIAVGINDHEVLGRGGVCAASAVLPSRWRHSLRRTTAKASGRA